MSFRQWAQVLGVLCLLSWERSAFTQAPAPRLRGPIATSKRATLAHSHSPQARPEDDEGSLASSTALPGITLVFKRSAAQQADLDQLLADLQNPASPQYHQWLTPETFGARFGMAEADLAATEAWLQSQGFHIDSVTPARDRITFSGNALQVQAAFGTELHHFRTNGEQHFAPASDLSLPTSLAEVTAAVLHLSDFRPRPNIPTQARPQPDYTEALTQAHYLTPADLATMYDLNGLYKSNFKGAGQSLVVVGQSYFDPTVINKFENDNAFGYYNSIGSIIVPLSGVAALSPGDQTETEVDVEYSSSIAPGANVSVVYTSSNQNYNVFDALSFAISENVAPVVSISYGICEPLLSSTELDAANGSFQQAAIQGQTLIASSGDSGSTSCARYSTAQGLSAAQQQALAVSFPASSPYVTAIGGTQMAAGTFSANNSSYWTAAGTSAVTSSVLSYVPEVVWNEGSTSAGIIAGGGGISTHFARPTWQSGLSSIPAGPYRLLPDIALQASVSSPGFVFCTSDSAVLGAFGQTAGCSNGFVGSNLKVDVTGGTSFAAPVFAGFIAILNQLQHLTGSGNLNPLLYQLAADPSTYASAFHDITAGTIACVTGATNCTTVSQSGYPAAVGYDLATGLGSLDFGKLASAWPTSSTAKLTPTATALSTLTNVVSSGTVLSISIQVCPTVCSSGGFVPGSTPTGAVSVSVDGVLANAALPLAPYGSYYGSASSTYSYTSPATAGPHLIRAVYSGDSTHAPSVSVLEVSVGSFTATGSFTLAATNVTMPANSNGNTVVTVTPSGSYNGRVFWSLAVASASSTYGQTLCYYIAPLSTPNSTSTKLLLGAGTACSATLTGQKRELLPFPTHQKQEIQEATVHERFRGTTIAYSAALLCGLLLPVRRKFRLTLLPLFALLLVPLSGLTGCGGASNPAATTATTTTTTAPTPAPAVYTVTLTGTDSVSTSIRATTTFTLTVN